MKLIQTVEVRQVVTERSKQELAAAFAARKQQLERECGQLRFEQKRMEKSGKYPASLVKQYFAKEIDDRMEKIKLLEFQLEQLHMLPLGSELKEREVEALIEVNVGDRWEEVTKTRVIIVEDGVVKEIR
ncbi:YlqD family protein [Anoxybacillus geothermalis]|nr:YlqD family protein [Anoxybacillus geothermalis]WJQ11709.1 YlqD family protein [Geobacillus stearothermophilus]